MPIKVLDMFCGMSAFRAAAELIGATEGLGWYVKNFSDFADYGRVIVGILFIGIVVTSLMWLFNKLERRLLRYRRNIHD